MIRFPFFVNTTIFCKYYHKKSNNIDEVIVIFVINIIFVIISVFIYNLYMVTIETQGSPAFPSSSAFA